MSRWAVMVPLSLGSVLVLILPLLTPIGIDRSARAAFCQWVPALLGLMLSLTSSAIDMALLDAGVEDPSSLSHELL